jgi:hypothetical protein
LRVLAGPAAENLLHWKMHPDATSSSAKNGVNPDAASKFLLHCINIILD